MASGGEYNLRDRGQLNAPPRYQDDNPQRDESVNTATRRRAGKKSSITKRIIKINNIITNRGSRTKISFLERQLKMTLDEAHQCHELLMTLLDSKDQAHNDDYIEELRISVDDCCSDIQEYFIERVGDSPSECPSAPLVRTLVDDY